MSHVRWQRGEGLAFAADGTLYGVTGLSGELITIDPITGAGTLVGLTSGADFDARFDLSFRNSDNALYVMGFGVECVGLGTCQRQWDTLRD